MNGSLFARPVFPVDDVFLYCATMNGLSLYISAALVNLPEKNCPAFNVATRLEST